MNKILCFFGLHKTKTIGHGGFFSFEISQCERCKKGIQKMDYGPFLKWLTQETMSESEFNKYLRNSK